MSCPDCKGSGWYVGLEVREPCRACRRESAEPRLAPAPVGPLPAVGDRVRYCRNGEDWGRVVAVDYPSLRVMVENFSTGDWHRMDVEEVEVHP